MRAGDKVIFKYPERSMWNDTKEGIASGYLVVGGEHVIEEICENMDGFGPSVRLSHPFSDDDPWWVSAECCELIRKVSKRNLPEWW